MIFVPQRNIWTPKPRWQQRGAVSTFPIGFWRPLAGPVVSLNTFSVNNSNPLTTCWSGVRYDTDGDEWGATNNGNWTTNRGQWLDSGDSALVWVERTINSGGPLDWWDPGTGRHQCNVDRLFGNTTNSPAVQTTNVTITMWDAASGGSKLDEVTYNIESDSSP